jgi:O-antigen/teichoic acid export membrane protein
MAYLTSKGNTTRALHIYRSAFFILTFASCFFVIIGWFLAEVIDWSWFGLKLLSQNDVVAIVIISCIQLLVVQQGTLLAGIYRSARKNPRLGLITSINSALYLIVSCIALLLNTSPSIYILTILLSYIVGFFIVFIDSRLVMPSFTLRTDGVSFKKIKPYVIPALGHSGVPLIHALQNQGVLLVIGGILGPVSVGIFQTARVLSNGIKSILGLFAVAIMVELPSLLGQRKFPFVVRLLKLNTKLAMIIVISAITFVIFFGEDIYKAWLSDNLEYNSLLLFVLLLSVLPFALSQSFTILLQVTNKIHYAIIYILLVAIVSLFIIALGAYSYDVVGAAIGVLFFEVLSSIAVIWIASRSVNGGGQLLESLLIYKNV